MHSYDLFVMVYHFKINGLLTIYLKLDKLAPVETHGVCRWNDVYFLVEWCLTMCEKSYKQAISNNLKLLKVT